MSGRFLSYLKSERERLDAALSSASAALADGREAETLRRLRSIVDEQLASWARDLGEEPVST